MIEAKLLILSTILKIRFQFDAIIPSKEGGEIMQTISRFKGEYEFLHNYFPHSIQYEGIIYPTNEHAFQAAKTLNVKTRKLIAACETPGKAKEMGNNIPLRHDWEFIKSDVMEHLCRLKFADPILKDRLLSTSGCYLIEGNHWGDTCWGMVNGKGENRLGKILMSLRDEFSHESCKTKPINEIIQNAYLRSTSQCDSNPRNIPPQER